jgi:UDP-N-acetyl-D-glucosamine dehydrogenase
MKDLLTKIADRSARIVVLGQSDPGVAMAVALCEVGYAVTGVDGDAERVAVLNAGLASSAAVPVQRLEDSLRAGYRATTDPSFLAGANVVIVTAGTADTGYSPYGSSLLRAVRTVAAHLASEQLILVEGSLYPGTTEERLLPELEATGLEAGLDFELAYSPDLPNPQVGTKVVGGFSPLAAELAAALYQVISPRVVTVSRVLTAEMVRLAERAARHVDRAFSNEITQLCHQLQVSVWEVSEAMVQAGAEVPLRPAPTFAGADAAPETEHAFRNGHKAILAGGLIERARQINERVPDWVVSRVNDLVNDRGLSLRGSQILLLGVGGALGAQDSRHSPVVAIMELLHQRGARVVYHDPSIPSLPWYFGSLESVRLTEELVEGCACAVLLSDPHGLDLDLVARCSPVVLDTRNALRDYPQPSIVRL